MYIRNFDTLSDVNRSLKHKMTPSEDDLFNSLSSIRTDMATCEQEFKTIMQDAFKTISSIRDEMQTVRETIVNSTDDWGYSQVIRTRTDVSSSSHAPNIEEPSSKSSVKKHKTNNINAKQKKRL